MTSIERSGALGDRPRGLQQDDVERVREKFGVADEQIRRDHTISHILAALTAMSNSSDLVFFGGTALSRTYLPELRLSEDIDLITEQDRKSTAHVIETTVVRALRRSHGAVAWRPSLSAVAETEAAVLTTESGVNVRLQLLSATGYPRWPTTVSPLVQRYRDAGEAVLTTYTASAFAASKLAAWFDRRAARDLYDMWGLGEHGYIDETAARLFTRHGPTGGPPAEWMFDRGIDPERWTDALAHQGRIAVDPNAALADVRARWLALRPSA